MASTRTSNLISFSRSSIRRMLRSMSISRGPCLSVELDLHQRLLHLGVGHRSGAAVDVERDLLVVGLADPAGDHRSVGQRHLDQPGPVAPPVTRLGERPVDATGGHLEGERLLPQRVGLVDHVVDRAGRGGDVVEGDPAVLVDGDPQHPSLAGRRQLHCFQVEAQLRQRAGHGRRHGRDGRVCSGALARAHVVETPVSCCGAANCGGCGAAAELSNSGHDTGCNLTRCPAESRSRPGAPS